MCWIMLHTTKASGGSNHVRIDQAGLYRSDVAPLLTKPTSEDDYDALVEALDELLAVVGDDEDHPLGSPLSGDMIEATMSFIGHYPKWAEGGISLPHAGAWPEPRRLA